MGKINWKHLEILRSDNGGEFESKALADYLSGKGVLAERLLPYHHFQNGASKRYNRTVQDMGRSVLYNSQLGKQFWGYALIWLAWTLNCIPNKTSKNITPYKFFYGNKPQLNSTRVFGSKAYNVVVAPEKQKRLNNCAVEGLVVGHIEESKGWTFLIPATKKLGQTSVKTASPLDLMQQKSRNSNLATSRMRKQLQSKRKILMDWPTYLSKPRKTSPPLSGEL
jgi:hypothetical protein